MNNPHCVALYKHCEMTSKSEIEAQIRVLQGKLKKCELDPAFTPTELVRWMPCMIGKMLHMMPYDGHKKMEQFGWLTPTGLLVNNEIVGTAHPNCPYEICPVLIGAPSCVRQILKSNVCNTFQAMAEMPIGCIPDTFGVGSTRTSTLESAVRGLLQAPLKVLDELPIREGEAFRTARIASHQFGAIRIRDGEVCVREQGMGPDGKMNYLQLYRGDENIFDRIYVAFTCQFPFDNRMIVTPNSVVDHYPLSVLYNAWLVEKNSKKTPA